MCYSVANVSNLSTQEKEEKKDSRIFVSYEQAHWPQGFSPPPPKIPPPPSGLVRMIPRRQRLVVKDFPRIASLWGACSWLRVKTALNNVGHNRYAVIFTGAKTTSARRHLLKRKVLAATRDIKNNNSDYLFIVSGSGPKTASEIKGDINQVLNIKK